MRRVDEREMGMQADLLLRPSLFVMDVCWEFSAGVNGKWDESVYGV
jgi:hypothetical protein